MVEEDTPSEAYRVLASLVGRLGRECPWTKEQRTHDMLFYTRKECLEVEELLREKPTVPTDKLVTELGDVLFDVLMMIEVSHREHPDVTLEACCASACKKLERRSPYIFDGPRASTVAEAQAMWQAGKAEEARLELHEQQPRSAPLSVGTIEGNMQTLTPHVEPGTAKTYGRASQMRAAPATTPATKPATGPAVARAAAPAVAPAAASAAALATDTAAATAMPKAMVDAVAPSVGTSPRSPLAASTAARATAARPAERLEADAIDDNSDVDDSLAEWEADFRKGAGPLSESDYASSDGDGE